MLKNIILIGVSGGIGSVTRFMIQKSFSQNITTQFPYGTLLINLLGCFLLGLFWNWTSRLANFGGEFKLFLMVGFCGGFTTFSAFTMEGINLFQERKIVPLFLYVVGSVSLGFLATYLGIRLTK